ncbi:3D (Asp-Asp-Asp) domain-containing protein/LysM repeat protein [Neobacillus niacini]|uniref:3D domain-containing protein n=1 Tax=Neobacillus niacini TaxID=86668 RepID=UPI00277D45E2|nr:3D domain-containing protein [Neobacillus niacini]MDQ1000616.1 3D (Asp-Asp-Asp) domain-containing protein/LysM repeat protein [Neobacillus niacini]
MLKKFVSILAVAVLSVTVSANVQAASITVQKGDTLWALSRANNMSLENLQKINNLTTDLIHPGDLLTVAPEKRYTVIQGDTLWGIANNHQVTVSQIKDWNQLHTDLIHPGLSLVIFEGLETTNIILSERPEQPVEVQKDSAPVAEAVPTPAPVVEAAAPVPAVEAAAPSSKEITVEATAYTATCEGCSGITATGINLLENPNQKVISVDPSVIPLGSKVYVEGYGEAIAGDTGGAIKGNKIDVFIPSKQEAINFGRKQLKVTILN